MDELNHDSRPPLLLNEAAARRLLLAQALDSADPQGRLVGLEERERIEREALAATGDPAQGQRPDPRAWLQARAQGMVELLGHRQPRLAALAEPPPWRGWLAWGLPLLALVLGGLIDRIDNPRQVNLLSPPLLAFLLWNVAVYLGLLWFALRPPRGLRLPGPLVRWASGLAPRRAGGTRAEVARAFVLRWWQLAAALEGQRWRRILHTAAAAWAVGVALSIVLGGLVREYRVGWESTLLDLPQVHAVLRVLFAPVIALLPLEPFSQAELARLHFGSGVEVGRLEARRWVVLYVALLAVVVVLPRALLALWAAWRQHRLQGALAIALDDVYFTGLLGRVSPARIRLALLAPQAADAAVVRCVFRQATAAHGAVPPEGAWTVLGTERGDLLQLAPLVPDAPGTDQARSGWQRFWPGGARAPVPQPVAPDLVLLVVREGADLDAVAPALRRQGRPVLLLAAAGTEAGHAAALRTAGLSGEVLALEALPTWHEDHRLLDALGRLLPAWQAPGLGRIADQWHERAQARLAEAMRVLAGELVDAARDVQALPVLPTGMRQLMVRGEREAGHEARRDAMRQLLGRVRERQAAADARLLDLHGLDAASNAMLEHAVPEQFRVHQAVDTPQAGLAGAASGAAMGATVDLLTGGLTLGAASALGALVGGGAALAAAAWKNRAGEPGASLVMLDDAMLLALVRIALLRYLGVVHAGRAGEQGSEGWPQTVEAAVQAHEDGLQAALARARSAPQDDTVPVQLAQQLQALVPALLEALHGP